MKILSNVQARAVQMLLQVDAPYFTVQWNDPRGRIAVRGMGNRMIVTREGGDTEQYESYDHFTDAYAFLL